MELYAKIITDDKRFERMLFLELSRCGIEVLSDITSFPKKLTRENFFTVVDLDFCNEDISGLSQESKMIGFSHSYQSELAKRAESCYAFFHRPFLISDLISVIHDGKSVDHLRSGYRSNKHAVHDKRDYLRIDEKAKCVNVGREKVFLTSNEFTVMSLLCQKRGEAVSREEISLRLNAKESNIADVYICMIRKKIDERFGKKYIYTVRRKGYMIK